MNKGLEVSRPFFIGFMDDRHSVLDTESIRIENHTSNKIAYGVLVKSCPFYREQKE